MDFLDMIGLMASEQSAKLGEAAVEKLAEKVKRIDELKASKVVRRREAHEVLVSGVVA